MWFNAEQGDVDWDGLWTMLLSFLIIIFTAAIPLFLIYLHVLLIARSSSAEVAPHNGCFVFGKKLLDGTIDNEYRLRLERALQLIQQQPKRLILLLGGVTSAGELSEAKAGLLYLQQQNLPEQCNICLEGQSKNTLDNLKNARRILQREHMGSVALISNRYHLARCQLIANSLQIKHTLCAAEPALDIGFKILLKLSVEAIYIHWFVVGKNWARLTGNSRMLGRVT